MLKKINIKNRKVLSVISIILAILLTVGIASALILLKPKDYVEVDSSKFVVGKITDKGEFMSSDDYLCTKDLIACDGLEVEPNFTASSKYQIFFYDKDYNFINKTNVLDDKYYFIDSFPFVEYCRIMILPDRNGKSADEFKVNLFNKSKYINEFDIVVDKAQVFEKYVNHFEEDLTLQNKKLSTTWDDMSYTFKDCEGVGCSKIIDLTDVNEIFIATDKVLTRPSSSFQFFFLTDKNKIASYQYSVRFTNLNGFYVAKLDCSEYNSIIFSYFLDSDYQVYLDKGNK